MPWRHMEKWRYSSTILDLGTMWRRVVRFTPRPLYPWGNRPRYPLGRRLGGAQSRSRRYGEEKSLASAGNQPLSSSPISSLYRLNYPGSFSLQGGIINTGKWHLISDVHTESRRSRSFCLNLMEDRRIGFEVMKGSISWSITSCSQLKVNRRFGETFHHLQGPRIRQTRNQQATLVGTCFMLISCLAYSSTLKMMATCSSETDYTSIYPRR
jgi:hypothetical protein